MIFAMILIRSCSANDQLNFRPSFRSTPKSQLTANLLRPLVHSLQPPVTGTPTCLEDFGIDAAPIVTNTQAKLARVIGDFRFDVLTFGMGQRIDNRLTSNAITFLE